MELRKFFYELRSCIKEFLNGCLESFLGDVRMLSKGEIGWFVNILIPKNLHFSTLSGKRTPYFRYPKEHFKPLTK